MALEMEWLMENDCDENVITKAFDAQSMQPKVIWQVYTAANHIQIQIDCKTDIYNSQFMRLYLIVKEVCVSYASFHFNECEADFSLQNGVHSMNFILATAFS